jgi:hypothetical protein
MKVKSSFFYTVAFIFLTLAAGVNAGVFDSKAKNDNFVDFEFDMKSYSMSSPEIKLTGYITPNRNLSKVDVYVNIYGLTTTRPPELASPRQTYRNVYMGATIKYDMPILINSPKKNNIHILVTSVDTRKNRSIQEFFFKVSMSQNAVVSLERQK